MDEQLFKALAGLVLILLGLALIFVGPIFTIWSVNTLFGTEIPYDFKHWIAIVWLTVTLRGINIKLEKSS